MAQQCCQIYPVGSISMAVKWSLFIVIRQTVAVASWSDVHPWSPQWMQLCVHYFHVGRNEISVRKNVDSMSITSSNISFLIPIKICSAKICKICSSGIGFDVIYLLVCSASRFKRCYLSCYNYSSKHKFSYHDQIYWMESSQWSFHNFLKWRAQT